MIVRKLFWISIHGEVIPFSLMSDKHLVSLLISGIKNVHNKIEEELFKNTPRIVDLNPILANSFLLRRFDIDNPQCHWKSILDLTRVSFQPFNIIIKFIKERGLLNIDEKQTGKSIRSLITDAQDKSIYEDL